MAKLAHGSPQRDTVAKRMFNAMPQSLRDSAQRSAPRVIRAASAPYVMAIHLLQASDELRVSYPWSTPTAPEVIANYTRGLVLFGRSGSRWAPFEWRSFPLRAVITPETAKVPKRLRSIRRRGEIEVRFDDDFEAIIRCFQERRGTWITPTNRYLPGSAPTGFYRHSGRLLRRSACRRVLGYRSRPCIRNDEYVPQGGSCWGTSAGSTG